MIRLLLSAVWGPHLGTEFGTDIQSTLLGDWLRWTGLTDIATIWFHPTLVGDRDGQRAPAFAQAPAVAKVFGR